MFLLLDSSGVLHGIGSASEVDVALSVSVLSSKTIRLAVFIPVIESIASSLDVLDAIC